jgi:tetratricopeptide (TPR) repeat protein
MKCISADFNAMTEGGHVRLTLPCSRDDIEQEHLGTGDWGWLSDGELVVGAQLAIDDRYGLVGVPDWDTLVHLDEEGANDFSRVAATLNQLMTKDPPSEADEPRILQLLTQYEHVAPAQPYNALQETFALRRALALRQMGKLGLALLEAAEARNAQPHDPEVGFVYLDLLRLQDLPSAVREVETIGSSPDVPSLLLSACINILAAQAEQADHEQFESIAPRVLDWCHRLDQAVDRDQVGQSLLALSDFNRGLVLLRKGQISQARRAFERAQTIYPEGLLLDEVGSLQTYDHHAREVARRVRTIAERFPNRPPVAA